MRKKIIDDEKLKTLLKEDKSYKKIGVELGVSAVAVFKRVKKLGLTSLPSSAKGLTEKERKFCIAVASGRSRINAVMQTYDVSSRESAKALQRTLMKDPEIRTAIDDLMEIKGIGRDFRIEKLGEHMKNADPVISLKALDMGFKLADDAGESKRQLSDKSHHGFDLNEYRNPASFDKSEGQCTICGTSASDYFCGSCYEKYPVMIDRIRRYWNGDKCAACMEDKRCYEYCTSCKQRQSLLTHEKNNTGFQEGILN